MKEKNRNCLNCTFFAKKDKEAFTGKCFCKDSKAYNFADESPEDFAVYMSCPFYINNKSYHDEMKPWEAEKAITAWREMDDVGY